MINYSINFDLSLAPKLKDQVRVHGEIEQPKRGFYFNRGDGGDPIHWLRENWAAIYIL